MRRAGRAGIRGSCSRLTHLTICWMVLLTSVSFIFLGFVHSMREVGFLSEASRGFVDRAAGGMNWGLGGPGRDWRIFKNDIKIGNARWRG